MIKRFFILLTAVSLAGFVAIPFVSMASTAKALPFQYGVWLPFWQSNGGTQDISLHLDALNEVSPFSYEIGAGGTIVDDLDIGNGSWVGWFSAIKELGIKNIPTLAWFDGNGIYDTLSNTATRQAQENAIANLVKTQGFDGIDIDYESMTPATRPYFSLFIEGLAERLHPLGKLLTCSVVPRTPPDSLYEPGTQPTNIVYPENYTVLGEYCDEVRLEAYDQGPIDLLLNASKGDGTFYAPVADPDWVKKVIAQATPYIPLKKIMLGVPTYGYEYEVSWSQGQLTYQRIRSFTYLQAMDRLDSLGMTAMRDTSTDELNFIYTSTTYIDAGPSLTSLVPSPIEPPALVALNGGNIDGTASTTLFYVSFPDASSTANAIAIAKQDGLRGIILFKADGMQDPLTWSVMKN